MIDLKASTHVLNLAPNSLNLIEIQKTLKLSGILTPEYEFYLMSEFLTLSSIESAIFNSVSKCNSQ